VAYNKYYLKHITTISHKLTFVMAKSDAISNTVEKKVKEDYMEACLWAQRLESYVVNDVVKEAMTSISWRCSIKGPNLHVVKAHMGRTPTTLQATITSYHF